MSMSRPSILIGVPVAFFPFPSPQPLIAADLALEWDVAALAASAAIATAAITSTSVSTILRAFIQAVLSAAVLGTLGGQPCNRRGARRRAAACTLRGSRTCGHGATSSCGELRGRLDDH